MRKRGALAGTIAKAAADLIWPPRSLLSGRVIARPGSIEPELWTQLRFLGSPWCFRCGFPLPEDAGEKAVCGACAAAPPPFARARAALAYDDLSRTMVLELKHGGRRDGLPTYAAWMNAAAGDLLAECDLVAPTPLHWTRLVSRRFNQAAWLAHAVAKAAGKPHQPALLARVKRRKSQAGLDADQRRRNVQGVFKVLETNKKHVAGKAIVLIDDVFTTGATVEACAKALLRAKAARVDVLTLARVVRPAEHLAGA